ncbi:MAG: hypothetical protein LBH17_04060 [Oscillospiraceae bacterium]|nr:hypothetical protein [Oscillospiraceae bacterium]
MRDDLAVTIEKGSKLSIAAAYFSIYAYQTLKKQLDSIDELRFIFTSPAPLRIVALSNALNAPVRAADGEALLQLGEVCREGFYAVAAVYFAL